MGGRACTPLTPPLPVKDSPHSRLRFLCVDYLYKVYQEMEAWEDGGGSSGRARDYMTRHLLLYGELAILWNPDQNGARWRLYPKHHLCGHLRFSQNPRVEWAYGMEYEIGQASVVASGCNVQHMHKALIRRYRDTY